MVLHMPLGYTELFARSLDEVSDLEVAEAREGDVLRPGLALLAPAGRHLCFHRQSNSEVTARLELQPSDTLHRPAVDILFHSAADVFGKRVLGIVMTGMGSDGTHGAAWIKAQGGTIFTEAEETCVVYGMPRCVVEADLSDRVVPLHELANAILGAV
jgi:two-component system chemotaxis response regulator CheB